MLAKKDKWDSGHTPDLLVRYYYNITILHLYAVVLAVFLNLKGLINSLFDLMIDTNSVTVVLEGKKFKGGSIYNLWTEPSNPEGTDS